MARTSREFLKAARQRLTTAEFLAKNYYNLDATYLAGYAIECSLKALILVLTPPDQFDETLKKISSGKSMHEAEVLGGFLHKLGMPVPLLLARRIRRSGWKTSLRYESGRFDTGETRALLRTAKMTYDWVQETLP